MGGTEPRLSSSSNLDLPRDSCFWALTLALYRSSSSAVDTSKLGSSKPLVLYISRQSGHRRLTDDAHQALESALLGVCEGEGLCELCVARMEGWALREQVEAASRSVVRVFA